MYETEHSTPILYGSTAIPLSSLEKTNSMNTHQWSVYVRSVNGEDLSKYISHVEFVLHESFSNPKRKIKAPPFEVSEFGWGEFEILIKIFCVDCLKDSPFVLLHYLRLYDTKKIPFNSEKETGDLKTVCFEFYDEIVSSVSPSDKSTKEFVVDEKSMKKFIQAENKSLQKIQSLIDKYK